MVEWMDNVEMAIQKVCASRVYTSAEFKREKDNFHSLCKNLERADTKRWLTETLETLMKERSGEEKKEEGKKLEVIMERHKALIPRIQETLVKTECYWKCYSYGDDLLPVFEFIDMNKNSSIKEVMSANNEQTEEHIEKQDKVLNQLGNKRQMVLDFLSKGEKLMEDPNCPKFLEGHAKKLKEAWEETTEKANARKKALADNLSSWETFETQRVECHRLLDVADKDFASIKKIFDLKAGPNDFRRRQTAAVANRKEIESIFQAISDSNNCIQQMLPNDKKEDMNNIVKELKTRMEVLGKTDERLGMIENFNTRLGVFNDAVTEMENWIGDVRGRIDELVKPSGTHATHTPEDRVTRAMEIQEDIMKKVEFLEKQEAERGEIFPGGDEKVPADAKRFLDRLTKSRGTIDALKEEIMSECSKFSQDIKFWAEFQTGIKEFEPWLATSEERKDSGLAKPETLAEACSILGESKNFQEDCEKKLQLLDEAAASAAKMTVHTEADEKVTALKSRWTVVHGTILEWVARMTTLVECWNKLEGNVDELSSWVTDVSSGDLQNEKGVAIPLEKLEGQLNQLKVIFAEKQELVTALEAYGSSAHGGAPADGADAAPADAAAPAAADAEPPAAEEAAPAAAVDDDALAAAEQAKAE